MRRNRGVVYNPKQCEVCGDDYVPTSGRQRCCTKSGCRNQLERVRLARKTDARRNRVDRPTEKQCEWEDCPTVFILATTGVIPQHCPKHRKERKAPGARAAITKWRLQTINVQCLYRNCTNPQHPSGQGWCFFHYPILSMHGLSAEGWWAYYEDQKGLCPVCLEVLFDGRTIVIDHDHKLAPSPRHDVEHVRGLLHAQPCNSIVVGGIETAIANGWFTRTLTFIKYPPPESN